jgi:hypothetical protein
MANIQARQRETHNTLLFSSVKTKSTEDDAKYWGDYFVPFLKAGLLERLPQPTMKMACFSDTIDLPFNTNADL